MQVLNFNNGRLHQTAVFVDTSDRADNPKSRERNNRFVESLNGSQIKADIFIVVGDVVRFMGDTKQHIPSSLYGGNPPATETVLRSWAKNQGYNTTVYLAPAGGEAEVSAPTKGIFAGL